MIAVEKKNDDAKKGICRTRGVDRKKTEHATERHVGHIMVRTKKLFINA